MAFYSAVTGLDADGPRWKGGVWLERPFAHEGRLTELLFAIWAFSPQYGTQLMRDMGGEVYMRRVRNERELGRPGFAWFLITHCNVAKGPAEKRVHPPVFG